MSASDIREDQPQTLEEVCQDIDAPLILEEAAELTAMSVPEVKEAIKSGRLTGYKIGRKLFTTMRDIRAIETGRRRDYNNPHSMIGVVGIVYVVGYGPYVKIGYTKSHIAVRLEALQTASPEPLTIYGTVRGTIDDEKALHKRFTALHLRGEWFRHEGDLKAWIEGGCKS